MRSTTLRIALAVGILSALAGTRADDGAPAGLAGAGTQADQRLARSVAELAALRQRVEAEKLPLTSRLSELEARLTQLRRENDVVIREIEHGGFDASTLEAGRKLRQDEVTYLSNLLDEYVRNFESKLNPGESERYRPLVTAAKEAYADRSLGLEEKFERQRVAVASSLERLRDVIGGTRFAGSALDPEGILASGNFALVGPVTLFAADEGTTAGVAVPEAGSDRLAVRPIDEETSVAVASIVREGSGWLPFDPSRGGALQELVQRTNIVHVFQKGGPIMWPLLFVSILAFAAALERVVFILRERTHRDMGALERFLGAVEQGRMDEAIAIAGPSRYFVLRSLGRALGHRETSLAGALLWSNAQEIKRFTRGIPILDTAITLSPLLGLLGTVTGMMGSFSLIGGELSAPAAITGGIAEALIATAFGLGIAIVSLVPYNFLNHRVDEARHDLEVASAQLELVTRPWLVEPAARRPERPERDAAA